MSIVIYTNGHIKLDSELGQDTWLGVKQRRDGTVVYHREIAPLQDGVPIALKHDGQRYKVVKMPHSRYALGCRQDHNPINGNPGLPIFEADVRAYLDSLR